MTMTTPLVGIVMGSASDWPVMLHAANRLTGFGIPCESRVISAHRSPALAHEYAATAEKRGPRLHHRRGGRRGPPGRRHGGRHHHPGARACRCRASTCRGWTRCCPPCRCRPAFPVATFAIGDAGAHNAALFVVAMLARTDKALAEKLKAFRAEQEEKIRKIDLEGHI